MGDAERFSRNAFEEVAFDRLGRRVGNRMHQSIEAVPMRCEIGKQLVDLSVLGDVALEDKRAVEFRGELVDTIEEAFVLIGKGECRAFTMASLGDAVCNRVFRKNAGDKNALACEKSHRLIRLEKRLSQVVGACNRRHIIREIARGEGGRRSGGRGKKCRMYVRLVPCFSGARLSRH